MHLSVGSKSAKTCQYIRGCYFTNWSQYRTGDASYLPEHYQPGLCTHIFFAFAKFTDNFIVTTTEYNDIKSDNSGLYQRVNKLKQQDPNLKTLLSVGGYGFGIQKFQQLARNQYARNKFINSLKDFLRRFNFDGVDLDWEYPTSADYSHFIILVKDIADAFHYESVTTGKPKLLLTAAVTGNKQTAADGYNVQAMARYFDFVNVMTYDFHGGWEMQTGINSPLYAYSAAVEWAKQWNVADAAEAWFRMGMPREKIVIGFPAYGRGWNLPISNTDHGIRVGTRAVGPATATTFVQQTGVAAFYELCEMLENGARRFWDDESKTPYLVHDGKWYSYDDPDSYSEKLTWLQNQGYGGAFVWSLDFDDFQGKCKLTNNEKYPLIKMFNQLLCGNAPQSNQTFTRRPLTTFPSTNKACYNKPHGFWPDPKNCVEFFLCLGNVSYKMRCPADLHFDPLRHHCTLPELSGCRRIPKTEPTTTTTTTTTTTLADKRFSSRTTAQPSKGTFVCDADGFFSNPTNCTQFYRCVGGIAFKFTCPQEYLFSIIYNLFLSICGAYLANGLIKEFSPMFVKKNLKGIDLCKKSKEFLPEATGVISSALVEFLSGILSICCMVFLGFADDVLDLRWRHKLLLPTVASLPLLMVYAATYNSTSIVIPLQLQPCFGKVLNIGVLYYVYIGMVAVFCTNAINIYAGINGLEVGQSIIIAISILIFNIVQLVRLEQECRYHMYPASVFVGDTFCYFSGMLFAVVGILGHFSKTLMLLFLPQIFNFIFSLPQLFRIIPCPRHRLPNVTSFRCDELSFLGKHVMRLYTALGLVSTKVQLVDGVEIVTCNNFTLINLLLKFYGPTHEKVLVVRLLIIQIVVFSSFSTTTLL
ncbi:putative endochitinase [Trichinella pseudospiralis]|uniref:UDP-N-acetylglucosamine--dolichyl-phosphate N-acetylglucosaminephosphotransferase n=1 Tax=Trichinella pseudospiralis TaxID=6337 RepID=A0A0V1K6W2_TRIPS|nr:putative endochitinase [Trichinella pseudospiralis]KRZ42870.1 putative endochitinase [Trichinella pseudospiralis]